MNHDGSWTIILSWTEADWAEEIGRRRNREALQSGRPDRYGYDGSDGWTIHINGAAGELAVAKLLRRRWDATVNTFKGTADLGPRCEIRTRSRHHYELLIRPDDDPAKYYVLVTGACPILVVRGYKKGADARRPEWWKEHGGRPGAWFVPHNALVRFTEKQVNGPCEADHSTPNIRGRRDGARREEG